MVLLQYLNQEQSVSPSLNLVMLSGSAESLLNSDLDMDGPPQNPRQRMIPPDVQGELDEAVSRPANASYTTVFSSS